MTLAIKQLEGNRKSDSTRSATGAFRAVQRSFVFFVFLGLVFTQLETSFAGWQDSSEERKPAEKQERDSGFDKKLGEIPEGEVGVGIDEKDLGKGGLKLPLDLKFYNEEGDPVRLFDYFGGERPVILLMNYSDCPKMCSVQLNNLVGAMSNMEYQVGKDFDIVSVSIDPKEPAGKAKKTKEKYVAMYNRKGSEKGWNFLVGPQQSIKTLAKTVGFKYRYIPRQNYYSHAPIMMMCSPTGNLVRYIKGIKVEQDQLEIALVDAGQGKVGSTLNQLWIGICYKYDVVTGKYTQDSITLMRIGGIGIIIFILALVVPYWVTSRKPANSKDEKNLIDLAENPGNFSSTS